MTSGQLLVPAGAGADLPVAAAEPPAPGGVVADLDTAGVRDYWTPERMRDAVPLDGGGEDAVAPRARAARAGAVPRSTGKLFFKDGNTAFVCSASTVNTAERNLVITAGHCVYSTTECIFLICSSGNRHYFSNFLFVPGYDRGAKPYGEWVGARAITHSAWIADEDDGHDQAFLVMAPQGGRNVVDVVGGNGLAWNYPAREDGVRIVGWPAERPYDGETMQECVGSTTPYPASTDAQMSCDLTGGASGGPWFLRMTNQNVGFIWAVTSRRTITGPALILAMPFDTTMEALLASARTAARPIAATARAAVQAGPKKKRKQLAVAATAAAVGYGEAYQLHASARPGRKVVLQIRAGKKWKRVVRFKMPATGTAIIDRLDAPGTHRFRLKARKGKAHGKATAVTVRACPTPLDRSAAVVSATRCTSPVG